MKKHDATPFPGQISILEYLEEMAKNTFATAKERVIASVQDYLQRGEILSSLAREKFERVLKKYSLSEMEEKIFAQTSPSYDIDGTLKGIANSVVRPLLRAIEVYEESDEAYKTLLSLMDFDVTLGDGSADMHLGAAWRLRHKDKRSDLITRCVIREEIWPDVLVYGYKGMAHGGSTKSLSFKDGSCAADLGILFAWLILLSLFHRAMGDQELREEILSQWEEKKYEVDFTGSGKVRTGTPETFDFSKRATAPFVVANARYERPTDVALEYLKDLSGLEDIAVSDVSEAEIHSRNRMAWKDSGGKRMYRHFLNKRELVVALLFHGKFEAWDKGIRLDYNDLLSRVRSSYPDRIPDCWAIPHFAHYEYGVLVRMVLGIVWEKKAQAVKTAAYLRGLKESSRATVWMTKKNIPKKIIDEMQASPFNDYFGYVELDESVDIEKEKQIADEFIAFRETYLNSFDTSKVSLRFRKLGNHKALGLFFPNINCLCVDVNSPSSFIHEYGHCMDYLVGKESPLSDQGAFWSVYQKYASALKSELRKEENADLKKRLSGKSKYNLDYYLLHTESFARCFEIYCCRVLNVRNSICKQEEKMSFAYPEDEGLLKLITEYFDQLFASLNQGETKEVAAEEESFEAELAA